MAKPFSVRTWATPLTMSAFVLMAGTGVLMFFGADQGVMVVVHQWFSWFFLAGVAGHITANIRPLANHLKSKWGTASVALFVAIFVASFSSWGLMTGPQMERPIEEALIEAPLSALAGVTHISQAALLARFKANGVAASGDQSIRDLSSATGIQENRLLGIVFVPNTGG